MTDFARLAIEVDTRQTNEAARDLETLTAAGGRAQRSAEQLAVANVKVGNSAVQQRAGFQQLGFQLSDFTTQVSSGTSVAQAFAQQIGQLAQALQLMGGGPESALGHVAAFLRGPWGVALQIAAIAISPFIGKLFEAGDAADDAADKFQNAADKAKALAGVTNALRLNNEKIKLNTLAEEQFRLENRTRNTPFANDPNAAIFSSGRNLGGARRRIDEIKQEKLEASNLIKLAEEQTTALEKITAATTRRTAAVGRSSGAHRTQATAIGAAQKAENAALRTTDDFIARLEDEIARMGKSAAQLRALEIARAKEGAATEAQRQRIDELNAAREREIARMKISGIVLKDLAERRKSLEDTFDGAAEQASKNREEAFRREKQAADDYRNTIEGLVSVLDQVGGRGLGNIGAILGGFATGDFRGATGPVGGLLNALNQSDSGKALIGSFTDKLEDIFGGSGPFKKTLQGVLEGAGTGAAVGSILFGNSKSAQLGGAVGGAVGKALGDEIGKSLGKVGGQLGGPIGSIIGSVIGSSLGSLLKKTKTGSVKLGFTANGDLGVTGTGGNSGSRREAASGLAGSVGSALDVIAERLGGSASGPLSVSLGVRNKNFKVDPTGQGRTKGAGVLDFGKDEAAAIKGAIAEALKDGVIQGISAGAQKLLASGDVEKQLAKALKFQSVFDELKQRTDPFGFAMQQLSREAEGLKKIFAEAGASAQDYAQLEQLLALKREDAAKDQVNASKALKDFLLDLNAGPGSPLSLRQQRVEAEAALAPYSAAIASAQSARAQADSLRASGASADAISAAEQAARIASGKIDQDGFQSAANRLLGISRASDASGAGYFADFDRIRALTSTGIGLIDSSAAADLTPQIAQNTADTAALMVDNNELLKTISGQLQALNDNGLTGDGFFNVRNFR